MFRRSIDACQNNMIEGYNRLIKLLPNTDKKYIEMNANGVCSADVTLWIQAKINPNNNIRAKYHESRLAFVKLYQLSENELKEFVNADPDQAKKLAEYGTYLQKLHDGDKKANNIEHKSFRREMLAIWLFSLPLISSAKTIKKTLQTYIQPHYILRFYSANHVIGAFVSPDGKSIAIFDPNSSDNESTFKVSDIDSIYKYLDRMFAKVGQTLEAVRVFIPTNIKDMQFTTSIFQKVKHCISGLSAANPNGLFYQSLIDLLHDIKNVLGKHEDINFLTQAIKDFVSYQAILNRKFFERIAISLARLKQTLIETPEAKLDLVNNINHCAQIFQEASTFVEQSPACTCSLDYVISSINYYTKCWLQSPIAQDHEIYLQTMKDIQSISHHYFHGSIPLDEVLIKLIPFLESLIQSNKTFEKLFSWQCDELNKFLLMWHDYQQKKQLIKDILAEPVLTLKNSQRNNLFAAVNLGDSTLVTVLLQTKNKYDVNAAAITLSKEFPLLTLLQIAVSIKNKDIIKLLILNNVDVNKIVNGQTILHDNNLLFDAEIARLILTVCQPQLIYTEATLSDGKNYTFIDLLSSNFQRGNADECAVALDIIEQLLLLHTTRNILKAADQQYFAGLMIRKNRPETFIKFLDYAKSDKAQLHDYLVSAITFKNIPIIRYLCQFFDIKEIEASLRARERHIFGDLDFDEKLLKSLEELKKLPSCYDFMAKKAYDDGGNYERYFQILYRFVPDPDLAILHGKTLNEHAQMANYQPVQQTFKP